MKIKIRNPVDIIISSLFYILINHIIFSGIESVTGNGYYLLSFIIDLLIIILSSIKFTNHDKSELDPKESIVRNHLCRGKKCKECVITAK